MVEVKMAISKRKIRAKLFFLIIFYKIHRNWTNKTVKMIDAGKMEAALERIELKKASAQRA